ncbi:hypothetical protein OWV82_006705 [Melia azedarach]|uniref:Uncharacterized protein n=1 Tax=Melia azedarach TaxID=155640 RepID=A0ACC1YHR3_MELAZ|nr:hypothetical protein OWV82_006705 [Melia azedarach]
MQPTLDSPNGRMVIFLTWFKPMEEWHKDFKCFSFHRRNLRHCSAHKHAILVFKRTSILMATKCLHYFPEYEEYDILPYSLARLTHQHPQEYRTFQRKLSEKNQCISPDIWPPLSQTAPWEIYSDQYKRETNHAKKNFYSFFDTASSSTTPSLQHWTPQDVDHIMTPLAPDPTPALDTTFSLAPPGPAGPLPSHFQDSQDPHDAMGLDDFEDNLNQRQLDAHFHRDAFEHQNMSSDDD